MNSVLKARLLHIEHFFPQCTTSDDRMYYVTTFSLFFFCLTFYLGRSNLFIQFSWLHGNVLFLSEDCVLSCTLGWSVIARRGSNTGLMFNATQHPNETGHWFAFRESHWEPPRSRGRGDYCNSKQRFMSEFWTIQTR